MCILVIVTKFLDYPSFSFITCHTLSMFLQGLVSINSLKQIFVLLYPLPVLCLPIFFLFLTCSWHSQDIPLLLLHEVSHNNLTKFLCIQGLNITLTLKSKADSLQIQKVENIFTLKGIHDTLPHRFLNYLVCSAGKCVFQWQEKKEQLPQ